MLNHQVDFNDAAKTFCRMQALYSYVFITLASKLSKCYIYMYIYSVRKYVN